METVPVMMRGLGAHLRSQIGVNLSIPQFRALAFVRRREGASISDVAEHLEIALPSVSRLIEGLVGRGLVHRQPAAGDRRRVTLTLTAPGREVLHAARQAAEDYVTAVLIRLTPSERSTVAHAMRALRGALAPEREPVPVGAR
jgi:DNA-binding MarR family transcriptional regulator